MRIRTLLTASAGLAIAVSAAVAVGLWQVTTRARVDLDEQAESQQVARDIANMLSLTNEFVVFGGERATQQWRARRDQLAQLIDHALARQAEAPQLMHLKRQLADLTPLFDRLVQIGAAPADSLGRQRRELLLERLMAETQEVIESRHRWASAIAERQQHNQQTYTTMVLTAPAALLAVLLGLGWLIGRRVLVPLRQLQAAANAIRDGDLAARCASDAADELGDAARAVDTMAFKLQRQSAALHASEQRLRLLTDNMPALIGHVDTGQRYTFVNAEFERRGFGRWADVVGRTMREVRGEAFYRRIEPHIQTALAGRTALFEMVQPGAERPACWQSTYVPDTDDDGAVRGFYFMIFDITTRKEAELRVAASEQRLLDLTNSLPAMVAYFDMAQHCQYANDTALKSQGIDRGQLPGLTLRAGLGDTGYALHEPYVNEVLRGRRARFEGQVPFKGRAAHYQAHLIPDRVAGGEQRGFYLMTFDITALKEAQQKQLRVERQLRAITDNLPVLISYVDREQRYRFANATFLNWLNMDPQAMIGQPMSKVMSAERYAERRPLVERAMSGQRVESEMESLAPGTPRRLMQNVLIPDIQPDGQVAGVYSLSTDVTTLKQIESQLNEQARVDTLTGLPNRRQFEERLPEAVARAARNQRPLALMFLDIDHFKAINDSFGHAGGDSVLKQFATRLRAALRLTDLPARLAGDEFVVLVEDLHTRADAEVIGRKVVAAIGGQSFVVDGRPIHVTASVGIAFCEQPRPDSELMNCADEALYQAKDAGRDTFRVSCLDTAAIDAPSFAPPLGAGLALN